MSSYRIIQPYVLLHDVDGDPLDAGYVYIGESGLDAESNPIQVYFDEALTIPAAQPLRTINGYVSRNGTPTNIYIVEAKFSMVVKNKNGSLVQSSLQASKLEASGTFSLNSIADLVEYGSGNSDKQAITVLNYHSDVEGGGDNFYWDATQDKANHNGGTIIDPDRPFPTDWTNQTQLTTWFTAGTGTGCWVKQIKPRYPSDFGVKCDWNGLTGVNATGTDNFIPMQKYIDFCISTSIGFIRLEDGKLLSSDTFTLDTGIYTQGISVIGTGNTSKLYVNGTGKDVFDVSTTQVLKNSLIQNCELRSESGHVLNIKYGVTGLKVDNVDMYVQSTSKSLIYSLNPTSGIYDSIFEGGDWYLANGSTVSGVDITVNGTRCNENHFRNLRVYNASTVQFFALKNTDLTTYLVNNKFSNINYEVCAGGGLLLENAKANTIENQSFWDNALYTNHLVYFKANSGYESESNTIANVIRNGGALNTGITDIFLEHAQDTFIYSSFTPNSENPSYDLNGKRGVIIGLYYNLVNDGRFQKITTLEQVFTNVTTNTVKEVYKKESLTISAGVITVSQSNCTVDTEASAATDDLVTINGGVDGQILHIRANNDARDVVVKNAKGNIRLSGALDFTLDRVYDSLTLKYDGNLSSWIEVSRMEYP
jgi:hypothetical protein